MEQPNPIVNAFAEDAPTDGEDLQLVERARAGSREALGEIVARHQRWIYNVVLRMVYFPQDAEDVTQEILIKICTKLSTFEGRSSFRTWLYRIALNHVLSMKRRRGEPRAHVHRIRPRAGQHTRRRPSRRQNPAPRHSGDRR